MSNNPLLYSTFSVQICLFISPSITVSSLPGIFLHHFICVLPKFFLFFTSYLWHIHTILSYTLFPKIPILSLFLLTLTIVLFIFSFNIISMSFLVLALPEYIVLSHSPISFAFYLVFLTQQILTHLVFNTSVC